MKKLAFFLEGQTEELFVQSLVEFFANECNVQIKSKRGHLGRKYARIFMEIDATKVGTGEDYFVLITDCGSDGRVASDIRDNFQGLVRESYTLIIGLRDVRPDFSREEIGKLRGGLKSAVTSLAGIPIEFYLAVMEIEAWFLAENTHFERINPAMTKEKINDELGYFPDNKNVENRDNPSDDLSQIYNIVGRHYDKSRAVVKETVDQLNFDDIVKIHSAEIQDLGGLIKNVSKFFS